MNLNKTLEELESSYEAFDLYDCLIVCSNQLIETNNILQSSSGWIPLSVRKGCKPRVWLSAPVEFDEERNPIKYLDLIVNSEVKHQSVDFAVTEHGFKITINNRTVVEAGNHFDGNLEIVKLDLNPIGLDIHGDVQGLVVGGMTMSRSSARRSNTFIGM